MMCIGIATDAGLPVLLFALCSWGVAIAITAGELDGDAAVSDEALELHTDGQ